MRVADVMTRDVQVIHPDHSVQDAARLMDDLNVGIVPVCDRDELVGVITDRDITVRSTAAGLDPRTTRIHEVMTDGAWWCRPEDDVAEVERVMSQRLIRRLPVLDDEQRVVGIVALGDLATDDAPGAEQALRRISEPSEPDRSVRRGQW